MSETPISARDGALAKLAAEAARFTAPSEPRHTTIRAVPEEPPHPPAATPPPPVAATPAGARPANPAGYVPVAVAPERGNTRPVVPVDGRLHMRIAPAMLAELDTVARSWRDNDPVALRDLERATLVRVGIALALADITQNGTSGAVGEAIRTALDPAVRHTDAAMPTLARWIRDSPQEQAAAHLSAEARPAGAAHG